MVRSTGLQAGRWRVQLPVASLQFLIDFILPGSTQPRTEIRTRNISYRWGGGGLRPSCADCLIILGASALRACPGPQRDSKQVKRICFYKFRLSLAIRKKTCCLLTQVSRNSLTDWQVYWLANKMRELDTRWTWQNHNVQALRLSLKFLSRCKTLLEFFQLFCESSIYTAWSVAILYPP